MADHPGAGVVSKGARLVLDIESEVGARSFTLEPGGRVLIGRKADADLRINRSSISQEHFEIVWDGTEIKMRDLGSKFGSFRLPQDSPFQEASFPAVYAPVELKLAKSKISFRWHRDGETFSSGPESTEVVPGTQVQEPTGIAGLTLVGAPVAAPAAVPMKPLDLESSPVAPAARAPLAPAAASRFPLPRIFFAVASLSLLSSLYSGRKLLLSAVTSSWALRNGGAWDLAALWVVDALPAVFAAIVLIAAMSLLAKRRRLGFPVKSVALVLLSALWIPLLLSFYGVSPWKWGKVRQLRSNFIDAPATPGPVDLPARVQALKQMKKDFPGSSLLYKALLDTQRKRVLQECGGEGESSAWENKKICLVLLFAVSVEAREEIRPALLDDVSARVSILLSLDGITRVLSVEGIDAPMVPFFLESLEMVGLDREKQDILKILGEAKDKDSLRSVIGVLKDLRGRIELLLSERQAKLGYPKSLRVEVPGPLESGI